MINELILGEKYFIYFDNENFKCLKKKERRPRIVGVTLEKITSIGKDHCLYTFKAKKKIFDEGRSMKRNRLVLCDNDPHILTELEIKIKKDDDIEKVCSEHRLKKNNFKKAHKKHRKK